MSKLWTKKSQDSEKYLQGLRRKPRRSSAGEASCSWLRDEPEVSVRVLLEQGPTAIGKGTISEQESQRKQYLKWPRRESSTTALKAAVKIGGLSYPHKGKRGNEAKVLKTKDRKGSGASTHDQCQEVWNIAKRCGVTESSSSSTDRPTVTFRVFGLLLG